MSNRFDFLIIEEMVDLGSKVLDIGCDDGSLLKMLQDKKKVDARGIELYSDRVNLCLEKGLPVVQGDANFDLEMYPDNSFDYVILSKTLQSVNEPLWIYLSSYFVLVKKQLSPFQILVGRSDSTWH